MYLDLIFKNSFILGLFHRAIAHSGTNLAPWSQPANKGFAATQAKKLAELFDCYDPDALTTDILDCLREVPASKMSLALYTFFVSIRDIISDLANYLYLRDI